MVRKERLELSHLTILVPKTSASTNSATLACSLYQGWRPYFLIWGERRGLNPRPPESQSGALPTELRPPHQNRLRCLNVYLNGYCFQLHKFRSGAPGRNRTCNPRLRRPMLYPIELRAQKLSCRPRLLSDLQRKPKKLVGVERFELPTSCSQSRRATRLRYTPTSSTRLVPMGSSR